jgi:glycerol-3-phosphate dehydrogenase
VPWHKVRNDIAAVIPVPGDKRSVFVVPWGDFTFIGTTDTDYDGGIDDPQCTAEDIEYLLRAINGSVTTDITVEDIVGTWAGGGGPGAAPRTCRVGTRSRNPTVGSSPSPVGNSPPIARWPLTPSTNSSPMCSAMRSVVGSAGVP